MLRGPRPSARPSPGSVQRDHHARAAPALHQAGGHDPDHAGVPALPRHHDRGLVGLRRARRPRRRTGSASRPPGGRGSGSRARGPPRRRGRRRSVRSSSSAASARCMRPAALMRGPSRKPSECSDSSAGCHAADLHQRAQAGLPRPAELHEALAHDAAVLAAQRHEVADRGERGEVDVLRRLGRVAARRGVQRLAQLQHHARRAQLRAAVVAERGMDDRAVRAARRRAGGGR